MKQNELLGDTLEYLNAQIADQAESSFLAKKAM